MRDGGERREKGDDAVEEMRCDPIGRLIIGQASDYPGSHAGEL